MSESDTFWPYRRAQDGARRAFGEARHGADQAERPELIVGVRDTFWPNRLEREKAAHLANTASLERKNVQEKERLKKEMLIKIKEMTEDQLHTRRLTNGRTPTMIYDEHFGLIRKKAKHQHLFI